MGSHHHTDPIFDKKKRAGRKEIKKWQIQLNDEQKIAKSIIISNPVTGLTGKAGSGKTLVAAQAALDRYFKKEIDQIIISRPTVSKEDIGFLPGGLSDKMEPWLAPIYHNLYTLLPKNIIDETVEAGGIEIVPFAFMRGRTFKKSFILVDEIQNVTRNQLETLLGRLGKGSTMVLCGDISQIDLRRKSDSCISLLQPLSNIDGFEVVNLLKNHRHSIVDPILKVFDSYRDSYGS